MIKIIRFLKDSWLFVVIAVLLLVVQAFCDLSLPQYTADIVDVGISQNGITEEIPKVMTKTDFENIMLFVSDDGDKDFVNSCYAAEKNGEQDVYRMNEKGEDSMDKLTEILKKPIIAEISFAKLSDDDIKNIFSKAIGTDVSELSLYDIAVAMKMDVAENYKIDMFTFIKAGIFDASAMMTSVDTMVDNMDDMAVQQMMFSFIKAEYNTCGESIDNIQNHYMIIIAVKMILLTLLMITAAILEGFIASKVAAKVSFDLRGKLFKKVLSFSHAEMDNFSTASLITRSTNDVQQVQTFIVMLLRMVAYAPILGIGGIIKVMNNGASMAWIIGVAVLAVLSLVVVLMALAMPKFKVIQNMIDKLNLVTREILTGLSVIRAFGREEHEEKRFDNANKDLTKTMLFTSRLMSTMMPAMMLIMNVVSVVIVWVGANKIDTGDIKVGSMMAFMTYSILIIFSFLMLTMISVMLPRAAVSAGRIQDVLDTESTINDAENTENLPDKVKGEICFDDVSFRYPGAEEDVIKNITFTAKPGETTAIIGGTGSGKSTLIHLIPRFYDITGGKITIDSVDIRSLTQHDLRENIGFVPQKGTLFSGTIASNLRFGNENASDEEIREAAEISQAADFINEKEDKYESAVAQGGTNVSGGQRQRLAIARAIAKKPPIYIFDDSFSALDYKTDAALRRALHDDTSESTVIIVAQRINTILHANKIIVIDDGEVAGIGTHSELMKNCDVYKQIAVSQLSESELKANGGAENE